MDAPALPAWLRAPARERGNHARWSVRLTVRQPARLRWLRLQKPSSSIAVATDASGRWALRGQEDAAWHAAALTRYWRGPCWLTLMLAAADASDHRATRRRWTITVWRSAVPAETWRKLNVLLRAAREPRAPAALPA